MVKYLFVVQKLYYIIRHNTRVAAILSFDNVYISGAEYTANNCQTAFSTCRRER